MTTVKLSLNWLVVPYQEQNLGLKVMADEAMKHREYFPIMYAFDNAPMAMMPRGLNKNLESPMDNEVAETAQGGAGTEVAANPVTVRKDFPETWIWMSTQTDANGQKTITKQLPDTITSWVISAFAIKDGTEIAVDPDPFNLNAFNPFFVSLNLPYSIRRGEKFELRATVFNYQNSEVSATVTLAKSDDDYIIAGEASQSVQVSSNGASSVNFMIEPLQIKTITLSVTATGSIPGGASMTDVLMKDLVVKPEGMERMNATTIPVMLNETMRQAIYTVPLDLSPYTQDDVVPGSRRAAVKITADMMGNAMDNIEKLVRQPTGCGEQNMITTVPNIFAMKYLEAIDDVREDFRTKAEGYMKLGFERETGDYRFTNGGYSAFGQRSDESATTWLTAFVVKSFAQASRYVDIDQDIIQEDIAFILSNQNEDGSFNEPGKVIHTDMQGGAQNKEALSIYIYLALLEAQSYGWDVDQAKLDLSRSYLDNVVSGSKVQNQPFLAAITAYAVALSRDTSDGSTAQTVRNLVQYVKDQGTPWMEEEEEPVSSSPGIMPRRSTSGASKTEITAYCLLAYNLVDELVEARAMAMYLQTKQNSFGGYGNTQDTVMALQAISEYAARFSQVTPDSRVEVTPNGGPTQFRTLTADNGILLQIIELPDDTSEVQINVTGAPGTLTVVKVVWFFYTRPDSTRDSSTSGSGQPKLRLTARTTMVRPSLYRTRMCINTDVDWDYNSMVVMMMDMPSGIQLEDENEASKQPKVQRLEITENRVSIYMDKPDDVCQEYMMEKTVEVENQRPGGAQVYAYYQSDISSEAEIQLAVACPPQGCPCTGDNCDSSHGNAVTSLSGLLLAACVCLLLSLALAV